jgi:hypothetical protein
MKKAVQLAAMVDCSADVPPDADALADVVAGLADEGDELACDPEPPLLPQAATAMPTAAPRAGTRISCRADGRNLI